MPVLPLAKSIPSRGNAISRWLGRTAYKLAGWQIIGELPDLPKFVIIVAPHTSNWDFFVGVGALFSLGLRLTFFGKDSIFWGPAGSIMRWLGGIAIDRSVSADRVSASVAAFKTREQLVFGVTPEGTRKRVETWKTGFYHVARGAGVPIVPVALDYGRMAVVIGTPVMPTGDVDRDMAVFHAFYEDVTAKRPENFAG